MRIVGSENPSLPLPPLDPLPLPSFSSWALQVESEEASHMHSTRNPLDTDLIRLCGKYGNDRSQGSSKGTDSVSRKPFRMSQHAEINKTFKVGRSPDSASHRTMGTRIPLPFESCDDTQRQARSTNTSIRRQARPPAERSYCSNVSSRSVGLREPDRMNKKNISPPRSHRTHHGQTRAALNESAMYPDTVVSEVVNRSCHTSSGSSENSYSGQSHRPRHGGIQVGRFSDDTEYARHQRIQLFGNKDDVRYGYRGRNQDVKATESAYSVRCKKPSHPADDKKHVNLKWHNRSSGHKGFRKSDGSVYGEVEKEGREGIDEFDLESRLSSDYGKQGIAKGCIPEAGIKSEGNGYLVIDAESETYPGSISPSEMKTRLACKSSYEFGTLVMQQSFNERTGDGEPGTTTSQAEGLSYSLTEGQTDNEQKNSSGSNTMPEMGSKSDVEVKEGDPSDTEKQYKMLASLLLDDSLDIDQDFDVTFVPGGPVVEYCGSIFDDDFELPVSVDVGVAAHVSEAVYTEEVVMMAAEGPDLENRAFTVVHDFNSPVSMDVEVAACVHNAAPTKREEAGHTSQCEELQEPHFCVTRGLFQDGEITPKHQPVSSNKLVQKRAFAATGFQSVEKQKSFHDSMIKEPSTRVFVDVTNKFEIHTAPVRRETQENDSHRISQRQRQVEFGKNTLGYERYSELVPRFKRKTQDPQTPNPKQVCSKRSWDGQIRKWRRLLHAYDLPTEDGEERAEDFSIHKSRECRVADPMQDNTRVLKSIENKACSASKVKIVEDANLTIYEDWIVS